VRYFTDAFGGPPLPSKAWGPVIRPAALEHFIGRQDF
jgi:hypothetical protein